MSRALLYGLLTAGVVGSYLVLVAVADLVLRRGIGFGSSVLATLLIALGFNPVRVQLQRLVDRALFGDRADPCGRFPDSARAWAAARKPARLTG